MVDMKTLPEKIMEDKNASCLAAVILALAVLAALVSRFML